MRLSYNKLQKLMIDNQMKGVDLIRAGALSTYALKKINKNEPVSLDLLMKVCKVFHCDIGDGWVFGFGGKVQILEPECIKDEYRQMIRRESERMEGK